MKFIVIKDNFKKGLSLIDGVSGDNLNLPILKNILIETEGGKIKLTATDLEISISSFISGKIIETGKFTAPAGLLLNLINNIKDERLNIEVKSNKLEIKTDSYAAAIQGLPADDFPITPKIKKQSESLEIKSEVLRDALNQVLVSARFSDLRPELNSVLFDFSPEGIKFAATDSFRLSEKTLNPNQMNSYNKNSFKILVPLKTIKELVRILGEGEVIKIYNDENQILFKTEQFEFLSRLIEGSFPNYESIIPKKLSTELIISKDNLIDALRLVGIFGSKNNEVKIKLQENKKAVELISSDQALGENNYVLSATVQGKFKEIIFNWRYIMDVLKVLKSEEIILGLNDENEPAQIKPAGDPSYFYILKPIAGE
jgi:DNA polymerase-3 subunit beta